MSIWSIFDPIGITFWGLVLLVATALFALANAGKIWRKIKSR